MRSWLTPRTTCITLRCARRRAPALPPAPPVSISGSHLTPRTPVSPLPQSQLATRETEYQHLQQQLHGGSGAAAVTLQELSTLRNEKASAESALAHANGQLHKQKEECVITLRRS